MMSSQEAGAVVTGNLYLCKKKIHLSTYPYFFFIQIY